MSDQQSNGSTDQSPELGASSDAEQQRATETLVGGTIDSQFVADRYAVDAMFEVLARPDRRYVLTYLLQSSGTASLTELIDYAVNQSDAAVDETFRQEIAIELTNATLPKLAEHGFVEYDMERQVIETTELTPVLEPYLRLALHQQQRVSEWTE